MPSVSGGSDKKKFRKNRHGTFNKVIFPIDIMKWIQNDNKYNGWAQIYEDHNLCANYLCSQLD